MERTWGILYTFQAPVNGQNIQFREVQIKHPVGLDGLVRSNWDQQLIAKQSQLAGQGITGLAIQPYQEDKSATPFNALYEAGEVKMWPGPAITLVGINNDYRGVELDVAQTSFPFITALNDYKIKELYISQGIEIPRPALAICTFAQTKDGKLTLTVRGERTNMYPGRFYGQGGNPLFTTDNPVEHQVKEMVGETLITTESYDPRKLEFGGITVDREELPGKPDLVGWVRVNLHSEEIDRRVGERTKHPNDAVAVAFVPASDEALLKYIVTANPNDYCPPAYAGLILYGRMHFGQLWEQDLLKQIQN